MSKGLIIAIDGPAGSGKSTSAKLLAQKLGYLYIDTGAMYRAITYLAIEKKILGDDAKIIELARQCDLKLEYKNSELSIIVDGNDISDRIRDTDVNENVSEVSKIGPVRKLLVEKQRAIADASKGVVMEGRDITTVVFPNADVKIFLTASLDERAHRRKKEIENNGSKTSVDDVKNNLSTRDKIDSNRNDSPLSKAEDAIVIDTTKKTIEDQVNLILDAAKKTAREKGISLKVNRSH